MNAYVAESNGTLSGEWNPTRSAPQAGGGSKPHGIVLY